MYGGSPWGVAPWGGTTSTGTAVVVGAPPTGRAGSSPVAARITTAPAAAPHAASGAPSSPRAGIA